MSTITLTFDSCSDRVEAMAAFRAMRLLGALNEVDETARACLKHGGDPIRALEAIRETCSGALEGLE